MRILSTLCLLFFSSVCFSQIEDLIRKAEYGNTTVKVIPYVCGLARNFSPPPVDLSSLQGNMERPKDFTLLKGPQIKVPPASIGTINNNDTIKKSETKIVIRCGIRDLNETPLIVVDGLPQDSDYLKTVSANDIESIDILKPATASALYGCRAQRGAIIITTKSAKLRKFIIKDFLDGNRIPGATVSFISTNKKDTIMMAANDSGVVITDKLKSSNSYSITVSSVGYKTQTTMFQYNYTRKEKEILFEKNVNTCSEVVVSAVGLHRRIRCYGCGGRVINKKLEISNEQTTSSARIFPNPATKGKLITIETTTQSDEPIQIRLTSLDGKLLLSQPQKAFKGQNRFTINTDSRWSAGIYFVQLYANGKLLASDKVIIQ